jgi:uncharacterized protein YbjT (DUF2867 family)
MILITGAAGKTGRAVIQALSGRGEILRALVHHPGQIRTVEALGVHEVLIGDLHSRSSLNEAFQDVGVVYHIPPNVNPDEVIIGKNMIAAAQATGIEHFVFHSVLQPQIEAMPHHWKKLRVEEALLQSGLSITILQPTAYMQNILAQWDSISQKGRYSVPYPGETRLSMVDLEDVAQAAATVLTEPGHAGATYELVGEHAISQTEVAAILSQKLNRPILVTVTPLKEWEERARASGLGDYQVDTLVRMFRYYADYGFEGNPRVLSWLLGRPPRSFEAFVARTLLEQVNVVRAEH